MKEILDKIHNWVELDGLKVNSNESLAKSLRLDFIGSVNVKENFGYNIAILNKVETVRIFTYYSFDQKTNNLISQTKDKGIDFFSNIQLTFLQMNIHYIFISRNDTPGTINQIKPADFENLESIEISKTMYFDGFNKNVYYDAVQNILHAAEVVAILFKKMDLNSLL